MTDRRVVITGIGPVTPIGIGIDSFWQGLRSAQSVVRRGTRFDSTPFRSHVAAEGDGFDPAPYMEPKRAKRLDRCSQFTLVAAKLALKDAGIDLTQEDPDRVGAMMGSALGGVEFAEREHEKFLASGVRAVEPGLALTVFVGAMMGSALGGVEFAEREHEKFLASGVRAVEPGLALTVFVGAASCNLAIDLGITGPNITNGMSCASR